MRLQTSELVEFLGAWDRAADAALPTPTSSTARVYVDAEDMILTADVASATVSVDRVPDDIAVGHTHEFLADDGTREEETVSSWDADAGTITYGAQPAATVSSGARVWRKLGPTIVLVKFGTTGTVETDEDWGFRGAVTPTHALGYRGGMRVRIELDFDGGADKQRVEPIYRTVRPALEHLGG